MEIKIRHIRCNVNDFSKDRHRFRFYYNEQEYLASCYSGYDVVFDEKSNTIPQSVLNHVGDLICESVSKNEDKWRYPTAVYEIADRYCTEEFN